jgi:hypothetical protein
LFKNASEHDRTIEFDNHKNTDIINDTGHDQVMNNLDALRAFGLEQVHKVYEQVRMVMNRYEKVMTYEHSPFNSFHWYILH